MSKLWVVLMTAGLMWELISGNGIRKDSAISLRYIGMKFDFGWTSGGAEPYCCGVSFLAAVGYLRLVWVVSGANHRTGGGRDAARADGTGARLAAGQTLLLEPRPFAYATGTPPRVCCPRNRRTTWETGVASVSLTTCDCSRWQETVLQKSEWRLCLWYVEALRWALWPEEDVAGAAEDEEDVECLLVPLVMVPGRTLARLRLLPDRDSVPSVWDTKTRVVSDITSPPVDP